MLNAFSTCWYFWLPMGFSGYSSTVSHGASVSMRHEWQQTMDTEKGALPVLGEAGLLSGKASSEGVTEPGWKRQRREGKGKSPMVAKNHNGVTELTEIGIQESGSFP